MHTKPISRPAALVLGVMSAIAAPVVLAEKCGSKLGPLAHVLKAQEKSAVARELTSFHESGDVYGLSFSPDSKTLATAVVFRREIRLWDWKTGHMIRELTEPPSPQGGGIAFAVESVSFSPDGDEVASCHVGYGQSPAGYVTSTIWNVSTGVIVKGLVQDSTCTGVSFSPSGSRLLESLLNGQAPERANLYDTRTWQLLWTWSLLDADPQATAISPNGRLAAIGTGDSEPVLDRKPNGPTNYGVSRVHIIDLETGRETRALETFPGDNHIDQIAWTADSRQIAVGVLPVFSSSPLKTTGIAFLDVATGKTLATEMSDRTAHVGVLRYTPDGRYLIESGVRDTVEIWDAKHEHLLQEICSQPSSGAVSNDGKYLALGGGAPLLHGGKVIVYEFK